MAEPHAADAAGLSPADGGGGAARRRCCSTTASSAARSIAARLPERRGESSIARPDGPLVWLHGASVGEMLSILPLIERIRARDITVLVTSGTVTVGRAGRAAAAAGRDPSVRAARRAAVRRALPRSLAARSRAVRRIRSVAEPDHGERRARHSADPGQRPACRSARSSAGGCVPRTIGALLQPLRSLPRAIRRGRRALSPASARRAIVTTGNLKLDVPAPPADPTKLWQLQAAIGTRPVIAAASTHPGEEIDADRRASPAQAHAFRAC